MKTESNLKLEWGYLEGLDTYYVVTSPELLANVWERTDGWFYSVDSNKKTVASGTKPTLLEAQQAAETALKDALKPYAELYARLGGEI